jgi:hypothetical protein
MKKFIPVSLCGAMIFGASWSYAGNANQNEIASNAAVNNIMAIAPEMFTTLKEQQDFYQQALLAKHPIIVALFNPEGGQFILYQPNQAPQVAAPFPEGQNFAIAAAIQHTVMGVYEVGMQGLIDKNIDWQNKLRSVQAKIETANNGIASLPISPAEKQLCQTILNQSDAFITKTLKENTLSQSSLDNYAQSLKPSFEKLTKIVATYQVTHWMQVVAQWKKELGSNWQNTYAVVMYIQVPPSSNTFLNVLTSYMNKDALNQHLFSFSSDSYTPTAEQALSLLAKAKPDKTLAKTVYGQYYWSYTGIQGATARGIVNEQSK